jgi:hypothetical protein
MADRKSAAPWIAGASLLLLLGGYIGTYYATVDPHRPFKFGPTYLRRHELGRRMDHQFRTFFGPAHWLDCRIRPNRWSDW